jgi:hypothetical protein
MAAGVGCAAPFARSGERGRGRERLVDSCGRRLVLSAGRGGERFEPLEGGE